MIDSRERRSLVGGLQGDWEQGKGKARLRWKLLSEDQR